MPRDDRVGRPLGAETGDDPGTADGGGADALCSWDCTCSRACLIMGASNGMAWAITESVTGNPVT